VLTPQIDWVNIKRVLDLLNQGIIKKDIRIFTTEDCLFILQKAQRDGGSLWVENWPKAFRSQSF
jgi:hypothetical protein